MNLSPSIHQVIAHFIPGFIFLLLAFLSVHHFNLHCLLCWLDKLGPATLVGFIGIVLSLSIGLFFDAIRTGIVHEFMQKKEMEIIWDFIKVEQSKDKLDTFEQYYYGYFVFEYNISIALLSSLIMEIFAPLIGGYMLAENQCYFIIVTAVTLVVFVLDVIVHKSYMIDFAREARNQRQLR